MVNLLNKIYDSEEIQMIDKNPFGYQFQRKQQVEGNEGRGKRRSTETKVEGNEGRGKRSKARNCSRIMWICTRNAIHIIRTLIERALEVQKDNYCCFIDYIKALTEFVVKKSYQY